MPSLTPPGASTTPTSGLFLSVTLLVAIAVAIITIFISPLTFWAHMLIQSVLFVVALTLFPKDDAFSIAKVFSFQSCILFIISSANVLFVEYNFTTGSITPFVIVMAFGGLLVLWRVGMTNAAALRQIVTIMVMPALIVGVIISIFMFGPIQPFTATLFESAKNVMIAQGFHSFFMFLLTNIWLIWSLEKAVNFGGAFSSKLASFGLFLIMLLFIAQIANAFYLAGLFNDFTDTKIDAINYPTLWNGIKSTGNNTITLITRTYNRTSTDYQRIYDPTFDQKVEQGSRASNIGVFLEKPTATTPTFDRSKGFTLLSNIVARTLYEPIQVTVACSITKNGQVYPGTIDPSVYTVADYQYRTIACLFPPRENNTIPVGSAEVTIDANYTMTTSGYTRRYYVSQTRLDQIQRQNQDPYAAFNIPSSERRPTSYSTAGPMSLVVGTLNGLEPLAENNAGSIINLWIKLENNQGYTGKLAKIDALRFYVPQGFSIPEENGKLKCLMNVQQATAQDCINACLADRRESCARECQEFTMYRLTDNITESPFVLLCDLQPDPASIVLGNSPVAIKSYRATAEYTFTTQQKTTIQITGQTTPTQTTQFTTMIVRSRQNTDSYRDFSSNTTTYMNTINRFTWGQDDTTGLLAQGIMMYFWREHTGNSEFCIDGLRRAGFMGLPFDRVVNATTCPPAGQTLALPGQQQIQQTIDSLTLAKQDCDSVDCMIGRHYCGSFFRYGDFSSCTSADCAWCHNTFIPSVITYAQAIHAQRNATQAPPQP